MCGGTLTGLTAGDTGDGLSPRVRGNPLWGVQWGERGGSIPACAGEPADMLRDHSLYPVYPRVCGGTR